MMSKYMTFAVEVAKAAGEVIRWFYHQRMNPVWTDRTHFKTAADDESEAVIRKMIREQYPDHNVWSEEGGKSNKGSRYTWVWDAVDGTIPMYTSISDHFTVCGALCDGETPILGVANAVKREQIYTAEIWKGAFCNGKSILVSDETEVNHVLMGMDSGKVNRDAFVPFLKRAMQPDGIACPLMSGCASVPLLLVASGVLHAYLATSLEPEDMAAAVVIIREAGGKVTNLEGEEWKLGDASILAANPVLHKKLLKFFGLPMRNYGVLKVLYEHHAVIRLQDRMEIQVPTSALLQTPEEGLALRPNTEVERKIPAMEEAAADPLVFVPDSVLAQLKP